jgi:Flp pilus assembly pilin Flp
MTRVHEHLCRRCTAVRERLELQEGQVLIEYALILGLVAVLTIGALQATGVNVSGLLNQIATGMSSVSNP